MTTHRSSRILLNFALGAALAAVASAQTVRSAAGTLEQATAARDAFRVDLGGGTDSSGGGLFGGVRREINWDGAPDAVSTPNLMPADQFAGRGVVFATGGTGFAMSARDGNPTATPLHFANFDPAYAGKLAAFSAQRLFASVGDPAYDVLFFVSGTNRPALVSGFGAVFSDVDVADTSSIEYFDQEGGSLGKYFVAAAPGDQTFSFLGVSFAGAPAIARVHVVVGSVALDGGGEPQGEDAVAADDFLYSEPIEAAGALCVPTPTALCLRQGRFRVEATFASVQAGGGKAKVRELTNESGALSFFSTDNLEVLIKVLDGCGVNDRFWVYGSAATDVAYTITVTDTATGQVREYSKEQGPPAPAITDNGAFATCEAGV